MNTSRIASGISSGSRLRPFIITLAIGTVVSLLSFLVLPDGVDNGFFSSNQNPLFQIVFSGINDIMVQLEVAFSKTDSGWDAGLIYAVLVSVAVLLTKLTTASLRNRYCPHSKVAEFFFDLSMENILFVLFAFISLLLISPICSLARSVDETGMIFVIIIGVAVFALSLPTFLYIIVMAVSLTLTYGFLQAIEGTTGKIIVILIAFTANIVLEIVAMRWTKRFSLCLVEKIPLPYRAQHSINMFIESHL